MITQPPYPVETQYRVSWPVIAIIAIEIVIAAIAIVIC
jgi:hypothetical protein